MLEIGCGSGGISHWFGTAGQMGWDVHALDVEDVRLVHDGYSFQVVRDVSLPFDDESFDVVVSNHVIEHVGDAATQGRHLREVRRVLRGDGRAYLAVPNRWMLVEPHFKLPFLSWLPRPIADAYVRLMGRGTHYDCRPLSRARLQRMLDQAGFAWHQHAEDALRLTFELENPGTPLYRYLLRHVPSTAWRWMRPVFPTLIYTLGRADASSSARSSTPAPASQEGSAP
jgi:SAM-dependent methyltransferase